MSESSIVKLVSDRYSRAAKSKREVQSEWEECRLFYRGDQWLSSAGDTFSVPESSESWRVRLTINRLISNVESAVAVFLRQKPIIVATPSTDESDDKQSAKVAEKIISHYWKELEVPGQLREMLTWMLVTGNAFMRPSWDEQAGDDIQVGPFAEGEEPEMMKEGQPRIDVFDPYSISVEPGATSIEEAAWVIITETLLKHDVETRFDVKIDNNHDDGDVDVQYREFTPSILDRDKFSKERIIVHTMYERPTDKYPNGRVVYCTPDQELKVVNVLPKIGPGHRPVVPLVHFKNIALPGELWATSIVSQAIPAQLGYNRKRSQIIENGNLMSRPQWILEVGSVEPESVTSEPGSIVWVEPDANMLPRQAEIYRTPQQDFSELNLFVEEMNDIMSRHEASQGKMTSNITSGKQALAFRDADNSRFLVAIRDFENQLAKLFKMFLVMMKENLKVEKVIHIVGRSRLPEVLRFNSEDISDTANISFEIASQLPWSADAMRETVIWMYSQGLIDRDTFFERMEFPTSRSMYEPDQNHRLNARQENEWLKSSFIKPQPTDDHKIHQEEHERDLNDPDRRGEFLQMRKAYEMQLQEWQAMGGESSGMPGPNPTEYHNKIKHLQEHEKALQAMAPQPPPPVAKVNISSKELPPQVSSAIAQQTIPQQPQSSPNKDYGEQGQGPVPGKRIGTPPGSHLSGEMYGDFSQGDSNV